MHLEAMRSGGVPHCKAFDDEEERKGVVSVEAQTQAAVLFGHGGHEQAFAVQVLEVCIRKLAFGVQVCRTLGN
ncbi:hypothetical protein D3C71_2029260 [compost metagenome]